MTMYIIGSQSNTQNLIRATGCNTGYSKHVVIATNSRYDFRGKRGISEEKDKWYNKVNHFL